MSIIEERQYPTNKHYPYLSQYLGQTFTTNVPLFYQSRIPQKGNYELVTFRKTCLNCENHERLKSPIRLTFIPAGTVFKVIGSFETKEIKNLGLTKHSYQYLVFQDKYGVRSQASESGFEIDILKPNYKYYDYDNRLMPLIDKFNYDKKLELIFCESSFESQASDRLKFRPLQESFREFADDFKVNNEISFVKSAETKTKEKSNCAVLFFKDLSPLYLLFYYGEDWGIWGKYYTKDEFKFDN